MKRGFTQTRLGDEVMYQAASGYLHMSVTLRKLKEALSVNSAPQVSPSPSPNPSPSPSPSPSPDPSPSPSPSPSPNLRRVEREAAAQHHVQAHAQRPGVALHAVPG